MSSFCTLWLCFLPPPPSRYLWSLYLVHLSLCRSSHPWWHPHQACWKAHRSAPWWSFQHHISQLNSRTRRKKMTTARVQDWRGEGGGRRCRGPRLFQSYKNKQKKKAKHWILMPYLSQCYYAHMRKVSLFLWNVNQRQVYRWLCFGILFFFYWKCEISTKFTWLI